MLQQHRRELSPRRQQRLGYPRCCSGHLQKNPISKEGLSKIEGAVINPPRAGARAQCEQLAMSGVKTIVLVSCNPETFASDAEILSKGRYNLDWVRVIDQFRWSHHIEVIAKFSRRH